MSPAGELQPLRITQDVPTSCQEKSYIVAENSNHMSFQDASLVLGRVSDNYSWTCCLVLGQSCVHLCSGVGCLSVAEQSDVDVVQSLDDLFSDDSASLVASPPAGALACEPATALATSDQMDRLKDLQDRILLKSLEVVEASVSFHEIAPNLEKPPQEWVDELGEVKAAEKLRVAKASWMNAKEAPVGLAMCRATALGIMKVNEASKHLSPHLNVQVAIFNAPSYETVEVDSGD